MQGIQLKRIGKTRVGRKILKKREPQIKEGVKETLFIKGLKTSEKVSDLINEFYRLKKQNSVNLSKRIDIKPFENVEPLEQLSIKNQSPFIVQGSNSKKRPDIILFSRFYDNNILDMFEFQIQSLFQFSQSLSSLPVNCRPLLQFSGDLFEYDTNYQRIKNYFFDFFYENIQIQTLDISKEFTHIIQFAATEDKIYLRTYAININADILTEKNQDINQIAQLQFMNPCADFLLKRHQLANQERFKLACKQLKQFRLKSNKNVKRDKLGHKVGTVYINPEKIENLALKKRRKLDDKGHKKQQKEKESIKQ